MNVVSDERIRLPAPTHAVVSGRAVPVGRGSALIAVAIDARGNANAAETKSVRSFMRCDFDGHITDHREPYDSRIILLRR